MKTEALNALHSAINTAHPLRLFKKQKEAFLHSLEAELAGAGYKTERVNARHWGIENKLLLTECDDPQIVFMAHYDTPTIMPTAYQWIYRIFGHTRQAAAIIFLIPFTIILLTVHSWLASTQAWYWAAGYALLVLYLFIFPIFFPNRHNAEDNTSGVIGLLALAKWSRKKDFKDEIQFVFLDNEEWGLFGSSALQRIWRRKKHLRDETMLINLDCISRGKTPLLVYHKKNHLACKILPFLMENFVEVKMIDMKGIPLSDNYTFRERGAVDISFGDPALLSGGYLISDVHTPKDRDFHPEKTARLINALQNFVERRFTEGKSDE